MAEYGRNGDDQTRDRESGRYGRDMGGDRGGWGRGRSDSDGSREPSRGGGMFGSRSDWNPEDYGWGGDPRRGQDRERERGGARVSGSWGGDGGRSSFWGGGSGDGRGRERDPDRDRDRQEPRGWGGESGRSSHGGEQRGGGFGHDDRHEGLPIDETSRLIGSNKVEGTAVYGRDGRRIGSIYNFMVDKRSGKVEYAVMTYGGFLGMGTRYYPMPWDILSYDTRLGGYRVEMSERDLERAPSFDRNSEPNFDRGYDDRVRGWYGLGR